MRRRGGLSSRGHWRPPSLQPALLHLLTCLKAEGGWTAATLGEAGIQDMGPTEILKCRGHLVLGDGGDAPSPGKGPSLEAGRAGCAHRGLPQAPLRTRGFGFEAGDSDRHGVQDGSEARGARLGRGSSGQKGRAGSAGEPGACCPRWWTAQAWACVLPCSAETGKQKSQRSSLRGDAGSGKIWACGRSKVLSAGGHTASGEEDPAESFLKRHP